MLHASAYNAILILSRRNKRAERIENIVSNLTEHGTSFEVLLMTEMQSLYSSS
jgi:hypothetical protein